MKIPRKLKKRMKKALLDSVQVTSTGGASSIVRTSKEVRIDKVGEVHRLHPYKQKKVVKDGNKFVIAHRLIPR